MAAISLLTVVELCGIGLVAGFMVGCVGIGGVIIVPLVVNALGFSIHTAIPAAMMTFLVSGVVGTIAFWRQRSIRWEMVLPLWLGAMPFALVGTVLGQALPSMVLEGAIGLLMTISGAEAWSGAHREKSEHVAETGGKLVGIGGVTGFASALTGTGGPAVLIPILLWRGMPTLAAIGLSQAIQLPIAVLATVGNVVLGSLDVQLGAMLATGLGLGTAVGAKLAHALPRAILRRFAAAALVVVGVLQLIKIAYRLAS